MGRPRGPFHRQPLDLGRQQRLGDAGDPAGDLGQGREAPVADRDQRLRPRQEGAERVEAGGAQGISSRPGVPRPRGGAGWAAARGAGWRVAAPGPAAAEPQQQVGAMDEMHAGIEPGVGLPFQAEIEPGARPPAEPVGAGGVAAALVAQRVARPFELGPQPLGPGQPGRHGIFDAAEHRRILAMEQAAEAGGAATPDMPRPGQVARVDHPQRVAQVGAGAEPAPAQAEGQVEIPDPLRGNQIFPGIEPGADHVLRADGQRRQPPPFPPQPGLHIEGAVGGGALPGRRVQPVGQPEGRFEEGQRLEIE